jgi:hypothetical protein
MGSDTAAARRQAAMQLQVDHPQSVDDERELNPDENRSLKTMNEVI